MGVVSDWGVEEEEGGRSSCRLADLVARELVNASAITVIEATMLAIGRGFGVPRGGRMLAEEIVEIGQGGGSLEYMPTHHGLMSAQKHESSSPQPAHDNVPLLADLN